MSTERRRAAWRRGRRGEGLAVWWLRLKGYRIVARGLRTPVGEIDLIARRGQVLALVEVKARPTLAEAAAAIGAQQRRRIERAAEVVLQRHPGLADCNLRFDAVLISPLRLPRHVIDAWREAGTAVNR